MTIRNLYEAYARKQKQPINEADFQKFQRKIGSALNKVGKGIGSSDISKFGQKMSMNQLQYNVGAKLDKKFNTQGYQQRKSVVGKYSNSKRVVDNLKKLIKIWNATMDKKYNVVNPMDIDNFNKDLEKLIEKYITKL